MYVHPCSPAHPMPRHMWVEIIGEAGVEEGMTREWLTLLAEQLFQPDLGLFVSCTGNPLALEPSPGRDRATPLHLPATVALPCVRTPALKPGAAVLHVAPTEASVQPNHLQYLRVAGRVVGERRQQPEPFVLCQPSCSGQTRVPHQAAACPLGCCAHVVLTMTCCGCRAGLCLLHGVPLGFHLARAFHRCLLNDDDPFRSCCSTMLEDLKEVDEQARPHSIEPLLVCAEPIHARSCPAPAAVALLLFHP